MKELEKFLKRIEREYRKARKPIIRNNKLIRGRSKCISGNAEDIFANLIVQFLDSNRVCIFIDQPLFLINERQFYYPDIIICKIKEKNKYNILYMIDLKMDVGWYRKSLLKNAKKLSKYCYAMKKAKLICGKRDSNEKSKERVDFTISKKAVYDMVIITSKNAGSKNNENKIIKLSENKTSNLWVLSDGKHPNSRKKNNKIIPRNNDFNKLIKKIKSFV